LIQKGESVRCENVCFAFFDAVNMLNSCHMPAIVLCCGVIRQHKFYLLSRLVAVFFCAPEFIVSFRTFFSGCSKTKRGKMKTGRAAFVRKSFVRDIFRYNKHCMFHHPMFYVDMN
jgi:hypothetical protein